MVEKSKIILTKSSGVYPLRIYKEQVVSITYRKKELKERKDYTLKNENDHSSLTLSKTFWSNYKIKQATIVISYDSSIPVYKTKISSKFIKEPQIGVVVETKDSKGRIEQRYVTLNLNLSKAKLFLNGMKLSPKFDFTVNKNIISTEHFLGNEDRLTAEVELD